MTHADEPRAAPGTSAPDPAVHDPAAPDAAAAAAAPQAAEPPPDDGDTKADRKVKRLPRRPRPPLHKLGRGALVVGVCAAMALLTLLVSHYGRQSFQSAAERPPAPTAPQPLPVERIEAMTPEMPSPPPTPEAAVPPFDLLSPGGLGLAAAPPPSPDAGYRAAWRSPLTRRAGGGSRSPAAPEIASNAPLSPAAWPGPDLDRYLRTLAGSAVSLAPTADAPHPTPAGTPSDPTRPASPPAANLLPAPADTGLHDAILRPPPTPYLLRAGTAVPAVLAQRVVSDQPGLLRAVVSRDVRDSLGGGHLLVPRGTVLLGRQGALPGFGQDRLAVAWTRLHFPDGRSLDLDSTAPAASASRDGTAGLRGRVRHRWGRRYLAAGLLSLVGAGVQLSQPQNGLLEPDTPGSRAAGALGVELGRTSEDLLRRYADLPPTIELTPGARVHAVLLDDLAFPAPYRPLHR